MFDCLGYFQPIHVRHFQVSENEIVIALSNQSEGFPTFFHGIDAVAGDNKNLPEAIQND